MDRNEGEGCVGGVIGIILGGLFTLIVVAKFFALPAIEELRTFKKEAVSNGAAEYDRTTGEWRWKEPRKGE